MAFAWIAWINSEKHWTSSCPMKTRKESHNSGDPSGSTKRKKRGTKTSAAADASEKRGKYSLRFDDKSLS
jgi:hypothetical protein